MPVKKLDRFFVGCWAVFGANDEGAIEGGLELAGVSVSEGRSLGEMQKLESRGDEAPVDRVVVEKPVDTVFTETASPDVVRYGSFGVRLLGSA